MIPPGRPYSSLEKLFFPFRMEVWICVCTFVLAMAIWIVVLKCTAKEKLYFAIGRKNDAPILSLFSIILGGSIHHLPRRNFARSILVILLLTTLVLRNAYLGNLFNYLRTQKRVELFRYIQDVFDSDVAICSGRFTGVHLQHLKERYNVNADHFFNIKFAFELLG